eukprot:6181740-Pleurochrysis_carterae.AAC.2
MPSCSSQSIDSCAQVFGKKFACGAALQKGKNGLPDQIEIQCEMPSYQPSVGRLCREVARLFAARIVVRRSVP